MILKIDSMISCCMCWVIIYRLDFKTPNLKKKQFDVMTIQASSIQQNVKQVQLER